MTINNRETRRILSKSARKIDTKESLLLFKDIYQGMLKYLIVYAVGEAL
jgi:hypothetical protein